MIQCSVDRVKLNLMERCNTDPGAAGGMSMLSQQMKVAYMNQQGTLFVLNDERERGERERVICFAVATFFITLLYM